VTPTITDWNAKLSHAGSSYKSYIVVYTAFRISICTVGFCPSTSSIGLDRDWSWMETVDASGIRAVIVISIVFDTIVGDTRELYIIQTISAGIT
jgi:hypothetical protein